ncbi:MAG: hypothetical protein MGG11_00955 [Trichodesmium sp. MAG_R03]|nr:hypothetical protein [Trichodesmium sp. MAG_R03]
MKYQPAEGLRLGCYPVPLGRGGYQIGNLGRNERNNSCCNAPCTWKNGMNNLMIVGKTHLKKQDSPIIWVDY